MDRTNPSATHRIASPGLATRQDADATARRRNVAQKPRDTSIKVGAVRLKSANTYECQIYGVRSNGRRGPIAQTYGRTAEDATAKAVAWVANDMDTQEIALLAMP